VLKRCKALEKIVIDPSSKFLFGGDTWGQREDRKPWEIWKPMEIQVFNVGYLEKFLKVFSW